MGMWVVSIYFWSFLVVSSSQQGPDEKLYKYPLVWASVWMVLLQTTSVEKAPRIAIR